MVENESTLNQRRVTTVLKRMLEEATDDVTFADWLVEERLLDHLLTEYHSMDGFGTEGQCDPRGDFRLGQWAMDFVQGVDRK